MNLTTEPQTFVETDPSRIRAELDRLLSDRRFCGARQMSAFLRYIVSQTLDGNAQRIKAYTVGVDALGKPDDFDAQLDPSVRVLALRLRKSLTAAYEDCPDCHARIVLNVGSYVPEFYKRNAGSMHSVREPASVNDKDARSTTGRVTVIHPGNSSVARQDVSMDSSANEVDIRFDSQRHSAKIPVRRMEMEQTDTLKYTQGSNIIKPVNRWMVLSIVALLMAAWQLSMNFASAGTSTDETGDFNQAYLSRQD